VYGQTPVPHPTAAYGKSNGAKLWYEVEGQGEPLVLIAGGPGDSHSVSQGWRITFRSSTSMPSEWASPTAQSRRMSTRLREVYEVVVREFLQEMR
jgi:pimeloyl-ACP methyl ester carboxylesterase